MRTTDRFHLTPGMIVRMVADAAMIQLALITALTLRWMFAAAFESQDSEALEKLARQFVGFYCDRAWPLTLISLVVFYLSGFYTYGRFYLGRYKALVVAQAVTQSYVLFSFISYFIAGEAWLISRPALILAWGISLCLLVGSRIWARVYEKIVQPEHEARAKAKRAGEHRVLVVGGAGYIGSALLPMLLEQGYYVRLLDMMVFGDEPIKNVEGHPNLEIIRGDFRHVECVVQAMQDIDSVIHLGAIVGDPACNLDEDLTIDINLSATRMIAELAKAAGVEHFIFASTCSVYGACDEMLDERSFVRPVSLYGHTKLASEQVLRKMANRQFHPTIVRFATIYGLSGRTRFDLVVNLLSAKAKIDGEITIHGGDQWRPFVHVEDAARALAIVLDAPRAVVSNEIFNVGSNDQNYTIEQIGKIVHEQVVSADLIISDGDGDHRNYRVDFSKIRNHLGFRPRWSVEEGVQQVLEAIASGEIVDYQESRYSNVKFLSEEGTQRIARDRWARQLIEDLAKG